MRRTLHVGLYNIDARITKERTLFASEEINYTVGRLAIMIYTHQSCWLPVRELKIITSIHGLGRICI